jgi:hypothetical protein
MLDMKISPKLHHYCQNITKGNLEVTIEMYELLKFKVVYTPPAKDWVMVGQDEPRFAIQITQVDNKPIEDIDEKRKTHVAFLSNNPQGVIDEIKKWAEVKGLRFREGGWSPIERYFDLPDIFVNFVVEVMHTSIEEE